MSEYTTGVYSSASLSCREAGDKSMNWQLSEVPQASSNCGLRGWGVGGRIHVYPCSVPTVSRTLPCTKLVIKEVCLENG